MLVSVRVEEVRGRYIKFIKIERNMCARKKTTTKEI